MLYLYKPVDAVTMVKGGARNLSDGSRCSSLNHFVETVDAILEGDNGFGAIKEMVSLVQSDSTKSLVLYNENHYLLQHRSDHNTDCIVLNKDRVYFYRSTSANNPAIRSSSYRPEDLSILNLSSPKYFIESLSEALTPRSSYESKMTGNSATETLFFVIDNTTGSIILGEQNGGTFGNHQYDGTLVPTDPVVKETKTQTKTQTKMEEKTMSKVNAIVTANKSAAQTAVKIEAGNIALDKLGKLIAPRMPFGTSSYLKSPLGKVVMANLISFAITQYAANNPKAKIISEAVMDAAALELVQSFNIGALIDDLVGSINLAGLEEPTGLDKYTV